MLQIDYANRMVSEGNEWGNLHKGVPKKQLLESDTEKTATLWTYMQNEWLERSNRWFLARF